jgi:hypothetical protein
MDSNTLLMLETHRANLAEAKSFEEYRNHHVAYCDMLIECEKAKLARDAARTKFSAQRTHNLTTHRRG